MDFMKIISVDVRSVPRGSAFECNDVSSSDSLIFEVHKSPAMADGKLM